MTRLNQRRRRPEKELPPPPEGMVRLDEDGDQLPCRHCGLAVDRPQDESLIEQLHAASLPQVGSRAGKNFGTEVTVCERHASFAELTAVILRRHPRVSAHQGKVRVPAALHALTLLRKPPLDPDQPSVDLDRQVRILAPAGEDASWSRWWMQVPGGRGDLASTIPYSGWMTEEVVARLRRAGAELARMRVDSAPVVVSPPPHGLARNAIALDGACGWCGVASQSIPARIVDDWCREVELPPEPLTEERAPLWADWVPEYKALLPASMVNRQRFVGVSLPARSRAEEAQSRAWHAHVSSRGQLGAGAGAGGPKVAFWLCRTCERLADPGPTRSMMEKAAFVAADRGAEYSSGMQARGIRGWGAEAADKIAAGLRAPEPNEEPWDHLGGVRELAAAIDKAFAELAEREREKQFDSAMFIQEYKDSTGIDINVGGR